MQNDDGQLSRALEVPDVEQQLILIDMTEDEKRLYSIAESLDYYHHRTIALTVEGLSCAFHFRLLVCAGKIDEFKCQALNKITECVSRQTALPYFDLQLHLKQQYELLLETEALCNRVKGNQAKLEKLFEHVRAAIASDANCRVVVVTDQLANIEYLKQKANGLSIGAISPTASRKNAMKEIEKFQTGEYTIFIIPSGIANIGFNLQLASHIYILDISPKADNRLQIQGRIQRQGVEHSRLFAVVLALKGTIHEDIESYLKQDDKTDLRIFNKEHNDPQRIWLPEEKICIPVNLRSSAFKTHTFDLKSFKFSLKSKRHGNFEYQVLCYNSRYLPLCGSKKAKIIYGYTDTGNFTVFAHPSRYCITRKSDGTAPAPESLADDAFYMFFESMNTVCSRKEFRNHNTDSLPPRTHPAFQALGCSASAFQSCFCRLLLCLNFLDFTGTSIIGHLEKNPQRYNDCANGELDFGRLFALFNVRMTHFHDAKADAVLPAAVLPGQHRYGVKFENWIYPVSRDLTHCVIRYRRSALDIRDTRVSHMSLAITSASEKAVPPPHIYEFSGHLVGERMLKAAFDIFSLAVFLNQEALTLNSSNVLIDWSKPSALSVAEYNHTRTTTWRAFAQTVESITSLRYYENLMPDNNVVFLIDSPWLRDPFHSYLERKCGLVSRLLWGGASWVRLYLDKFAANCKVSFGFQGERTNMMIPDSIIRNGHDAYVLCVSKCMNATSKDDSSHSTGGCGFLFSTFNGRGRLHMLDPTTFKRYLGISTFDTEDYKMIKIPERALFNGSICDHDKTKCSIVLSKISDILVALNDSKALLFVNQDLNQDLINHRKQLLCCSLIQKAREAGLLHIGERRDPVYLVGSLIARVLQLENPSLDSPSFMHKALQQIRDVWESTKVQGKLTYDDCRVVVAVTQHTSVRICPPQVPDVRLRLKRSRDACDA